ncbi:MAG: ATP-dependent DNA helicase RecG [Rhodocyclaceae bacterium]|nr:ATP-dependent DNA helicase RecG [Rhodocyclaceae bacterium]
MAELAAKLAKLGIRREFDLVLHLPLRYEDETRLTPIAETPRGAPVQVEGAVVDTQIVYRPRRQLLCRIRDQSGELALRFMNFYPSQSKVLEPEARVRAFGEVREGSRGAEMIHPRFHVLKGEEPLPTALTPVYPTTATLPQGALRTLIGKALAGAAQSDALSDTLPDALRERLGLMPFAQAIDQLHHPRPQEQAQALSGRTHPAWQRIKFDELLAQQLSMRGHYRERKQKQAIALSARGSHVSRLLERLPFALTGAQARAWSEIGADIALPRPMHRLLQGDVGSGKTIVAALACLRAVENGVQAAVMAPTEILAEQHFHKFSEWLEPLGVKMAWLSGGQSKAERAAALAAIASGETQVAIGTHALFQKQVRFASLALAIVDEQHRFGVAQRLALRRKGAEARPSQRSALQPHLLMMSATPIPRTLSMSYYADLDVSVIDQAPPGRKPVLTKLLSDARRDEVMQRIREACRAGEQVYWVCPLIEESEALQLKTAEETYALLKSEFPELAVGLMHGRLGPEEKLAVMSAFIAGKIHLLVATTVIEVGVDVPNASVMVIEHAERFGLAQLHQLRGRIGRGSAESVCVLLYQSPLSETARSRLRVIYENSDGFEIAREDLRLRGPGEYLGARQSGLPLLRYADIEGDTLLLEQARSASELLMKQHPDLAQRHLDRWLGSRNEFMKV